MQNLKNIQNVKYEQFEDGFWVTHAHRGFDNFNVLSEINEIPVVGLKEDAFNQHKDIRSLTLPNSIKTIESCAFYYCISLEEIKFPDSIETIPYSCFHSCSSLESIRIPNSVTIIDDMAFVNCKSLKTITIPDNIQKIDKFAFIGCHNIMHVQFSRTLVDRPDADEIFNQLFEAGLRTREILLRIPSM